MTAFAQALCAALMVVSAFAARKDIRKIAALHKDPRNSVSGSRMSVSGMRNTASMFVSKTSGVTGLVAEVANRRKEGVQAVLLVDFDGTGDEKTNGLKFRGADQILDLTPEDVALKQQEVATMVGEFMGRLGGEMKFQICTYVGTSIGKSDTISNDTPFRNMKAAVLTGCRGAMIQQFLPPIAGAELPTKTVVYFNTEGFASVGVKAYLGDAAPACEHADVIPRTKGKRSVVEDFEKVDITCPETEDREVERSVASLKASGIQASKVASVQLGVPDMGSVTGQFGVSNSDKPLW